MRILVDECTGPGVARWLRDEMNYEVFSVYDEAPGTSDSDLIVKAFEEDWVIVTNDRDFGEKVFKERLPHRGIVFLRLEDERTPKKILVLRKLLDNHSPDIPNRFVVVTETQVRFSSKHQ